MNSGPPQGPRDRSSLVPPPPASASMPPPPPGRASLAPPPSASASMPPPPRVSQVPTPPSSPSLVPSAPSPMGHADVGRRMTPQGAQEYFLRVVPLMERENADLRRRVEEQTERNNTLSHAMGLLTAQLLSAYAELERLRDIAAAERGSRDELRASPTISNDRVYKLLRALVELSPQEVTEYMVRRKEVHAILTALRGVLVREGERRG